MKNREDLGELLEDISEFDYVYFQPPSKMNYPCILYERENFNSSYADNIAYKNKEKYTVTIIGKDPDNDELIEKMLLNIKYCSFDRRYKSSENLYHDVLIIYW